MEIAKSSDSLEALRLAVEQGDSKAQSDLGLRFYMGEGVTEQAQKPTLTSRGFFISWLANAQQPRYSPRNGYG